MCLPLFLLPGISWARENSASRSPASRLQGCVVDVEEDSAPQHCLERRSSKRPLRRERDQPRDAVLFASAYMNRTCQISSRRRNVDAAVLVRTVDPFFDLQAGDHFPRSPYAERYRHEARRATPYADLYVLAVKSSTLLQRRVTCVLLKPPHVFKSCVTRTATQHPRGKQCAPHNSPMDFCGAVQQLPIRLKDHLWPMVRGRAFGIALSTRLD